MASLPSTVKPRSMHRVSLAISRQRPAPPRPCKAASTRCQLSSLQREPQRPASKWKGLSPNSAGIAVHSCVGVQNGIEKDWNQDAWLVEDVHPTPLHAATTIGIFDGHGPQGHFAARHVAGRLASAIRECAADSLVMPVEKSWWDYDYVPVGGGLVVPGGDPAGASALAPSEACLELALSDFTFDSAQACLGEAFSRAAEEVAAADCFFANSGSTAVVCMVLPDSVVAAWAGDSRAVIGTAEGNRYVATQLTRDHKPERLSELARVLSAGGRVSRPALDVRGNPTGPFRIRLPTGPSPALSVARSFGDLLLSSIGVVPTPDFAVYSRAADTMAPTSKAPAEMLIVASDGLWEVVGNQEAVDLVADAGSPEEGAARLVDKAKHRWRARSRSRHIDDITVAVTWL